MKKMLLFASVLTVPLVLAAATPVVSQGHLLSPDEGSGAPHGKDLFIAMKCNMCHSIESQDVEAKTKSEKMKGPDLSNIGSEKDAKFITGWLKKEIEVDGKTHKGSFKGTDDELKELVDWLGTLKKADS